MEIFLFPAPTQKRTGRCLIPIGYVFLLRHRGHTYHWSRTALYMRRRCSHKRTQRAFLCTSLHYDTNPHSCCNAPDSLAPHQESPWLSLPGPGPVHSAAETGCIPGSPSVWWPSHLKGKHCTWRHVPRCLIQDLKTKQN